MSRYIDADALKKRMLDYFSPPEAFDVADLRPSWAIQDGIEDIFATFPTADVAPVVHGEWIKMDKRGKNVQCSKCGNTLDLRGVNAGRGDANYCPNCGTKMDDNDSIPFNARWEIDERELGGYDS